MKYIGFVSEYDKFPSALPFHELISNIQDKTKLDPMFHTYLDHGHLVFEWMSGFIDIESKMMVPRHYYCTDGEWVWPSYLRDHLKKYPNMYVDKEFVHHAVQNNFRVPSLSKERIVAIADEMVRFLSG